MFFVQRIAILIGAAVTLGSVAGAADPNAVERTIEVRVIDENDKPMPGAKVHAAIWSNDPPKGNRDFLSDADGKVLVALPQSVDILRLWATAPGRVGLFANWGPKRIPMPLDSKIPEQFTFRLVKGTTIGGFVKNQEGEPIMGAKVEVRLTMQPGEEVRNRPALTTWLSEGSDAATTDADGRWSIDNVPPGGDVEVQLNFTHLDYISDYAWGELQTEQGTTMQELRDGTATIVMPRGIAVGGFLVDDDVRKVTNAIVVWGEDPYFQKGSQEVRPDPNGAYRLPPLPAGPLTVTVVAPGWAPEQKTIDVSLNDNRVNFTLKPGKIITIRFVDRQGAPVPRVGVGIDSWRGNKALYNHKHPNVLDSKIPNHADKNGVYKWTWAPDDPVTYSFYHEKLAPEGVDMELTAGEDEQVVELPPR